MRWKFLLILFIPFYVLAVEVVVMDYSSIDYEEVTIYTLDGESRLDVDYFGRTYCACPWE